MITSLSQNWAEIGRASAELWQRPVFAAVESAVAPGPTSVARSSSTPHLVPNVGVHAESIEIVVTSAHDERTAGASPGPAARGFVFVLSLP